MVEKKIPRAINQSLLLELKKIDPDINIALERLLHTNLCELEPKTEGDLKELAVKLWVYLGDEVRLMVDKAIEDAKRGY